MCSSSLFLHFFLVFYLLLLHNIAESSTCPTSFDCPGLGSVTFPLSNDPNCGLFMVNCTHPIHPLIQLRAGGNWYEILENITPSRFFLRDPILQIILNSSNCFSFANLSIPASPSASFTITPSLTLYSCINGSRDEVFRNENFETHDCRDFNVFYRNPITGSALNGSNIILPDGCRVIQMPIDPEQDLSNPANFFQLFSANFTLEWTITEECIRCNEGGGQCSTNNMNGFLCKIEQSSNNRKTVILATAIPGCAVFLLICGAVVFWVRRRTKNTYVISRNISSDPSSKSDIEDGSFYYGIPIFCYTELEEATNNFDPAKELGDGGFGTVYHGILRDGREVAIKRLYENNYKRVEQFMNEIKILTCMKHQNLVTLYGCTSRQSRELLLVYEYIQNGTVADHLHGEKAKEAPLTWAIRMNIAIETASALAYLHKSDIIHRDVKTNNILLDSNFCVKVADFGLSRLFPSDVTHISTAPQGTPGYVDPEYHQCYQLTGKSDVYSFGVVLIELISSMPAVDITRHRHEINLANLAINRIQRCAFDDLIDPSLGYKTDPEIMRMTTSVAELAFQCLQLEKDMRPSMDEVLIFLKEVKKGGTVKIPPSPETDEMELLKKNFQASPTAVTDVWMSGSTTASSLG